METLAHGTVDLSVSFLQAYALGCGLIALASFFCGLLIGYRIFRSEEDGK